MLVVKVGGGLSIDAEAVAADMADLWRSGARTVLVHGGAQTLDAVATALGHPPEHVVSESGLQSRRTDRRTLEIFEMVYCGQLNKGWVERLQRRGVDAVGLSGLDGRLLEGRRKDTLRVRAGDRRVVLRDDWTGTVERVNGRLLRLLLDHGYLPVLTPPGASFEGEAINVDGDRAASALAVELRAEALVFLTDVPGLLASFPDPESLVRTATRRDADELLRSARGRMKKKVLGAAAALDGGVERVVIADGRASRPIGAALDGAGTHFVASSVEVAT
jgi:acetylglutamate/LysW-gamma-L-alpha-aminoadipate kinase